jgi:succinate dehydrogenase hydrophobic anchor subunit
MQSRYWLWMLLSALVMLILLGWHMAIMHLESLLEHMVSISSQPLAWGDVIARSRNVFITGVYVILLGAALFHGFFGLRTMLAEYWPRKGAEKVINISCWVAGIILFSVGTYTTLSFHFIPPAP